MQSDQLCSIGADSSPATSLSLSIYNLLLYGFILQENVTSASIEEQGTNIYASLQINLIKEPVHWLPIPGAEYRSTSVYVLMEQGEKEYTLKKTLQPPLSLPPPLPQVGREKIKLHIFYALPGGGVNFF